MDIGVGADTPTTHITIIVVSSGIDESLHTTKHAASLQHCTCFTA